MNEERRHRGSRETERRRLRRQRQERGIAEANPRHMADGETPVKLLHRGKPVELVPGPHDRRKDIFTYHRASLAITGLTTMAQFNGWKWPK